MRISQVTQSTLKFHRQAGTPRITRLSEVLESVLVLFRPKLAAANINFDLRLDSEVPIACMPSEAQQVFANLLSNAIEATPRNGKLVIRLRTSSDWRDPKTRGMRVTFADNGIGMDRATMQRIFEPFFTTKTDTGTGLGTWVVAQLAERHHGHVSVWSTRRARASGSVFSVFLPLGDADESEEKAVPAAENTGALITG